MSNNNIELKNLNQTSENSQIDEEKNNIIPIKTIDINKTKHFKIPYFFYGNTLNFYFPYTNIKSDKFKYPIFSLGSDKKIFPFVILIVSIVFYIIYLLLNKIGKNEIYEKFMPLILLIIFILAWILYIVNPGVIYKSIDCGIKNSHNCEICGIYYDKTLKVKHCQECNVCISKFDHHCYAIGKCIGRNNFILFVLIIIFLCIMQALNLFITGKIIYKYFIKINKK